MKYYIAKYKGGEIYINKFEKGTDQCIFCKCPLRAYGAKKKETIENKIKEKLLQNQFEAIEIDTDEIYKEFTK